jgi:hypothetical protein
MSEVFNLASNFGKAVINHAKDGFKKTDDKIFNQRIEICKSCEFYNSASNRCNRCGCFLDIKAAWNSEKCPIGKW